MIRDKPRKKPVWIKRLLLGVAIGAVVALGAWKFNPFLIQKVEIRGDNLSCTSHEAIKDRLNLVGQNIFLLNEDKLKEEVYNRYPCIKSLEFKQKLPKEIEIIVTNRNLFVQLIHYLPPKVVEFRDLTAEEASSTALLNWSRPQFLELVFMVDTDGMVFGQDKIRDYPVLFWPVSDLHIGQKLESSVFQKIALVLEKLSGLNHPVVWAKIIGDDLLAVSKDGNDLREWRIVFSLNKDIFKQLASLQLIFQEAKINKMLLDVIDLRFDKPVIIFLTKKDGQG